MALLQQIKLFFTLLYSFPVHTLILALIYLPFVIDSTLDSMRGIIDYVLLFRTEQTLIATLIADCKIGCEHENHQNCEKRV